MIDRYNKSQDPQINNYATHEKHLSIIYPWHSFPGAVYVQDSLFPC